MDNLKLFSRDETKLQQELTIVKTFISDIQMDFGLDKCTTAVSKHGKVPQSQNISLNNQTVIGNMEVDETFKYLGVEEGDGIDNSQLKNALVKKYYRWVQQILKLKNNTTAFNILAVPFLVYSFRIVSWLRKEIEKIDWTMTDLLVDGHYLKRQNGGGCGLVELEFARIAAIVGLSKYIEQGNNSFIRLVQEYDASKAKYSLQKEVQHLKQECRRTQEQPIVWTFQLGAWKTLSR